MEGLPKLPGLDFENRLKLQHSIPHCFDFVNGYRMPRKPTIGIGGDVLKEDSIAYSQQNDTILYDPALTYGCVKQLPIKPFRPHYVIYDKCILTFNGFFKQCIPESNEEHYRVRYVNILYFMEDDSITVIEPPILNCGYPQGRIVRRGKIPKNTIGQFYTWKDFNVGIDIEFYGIVYHINDCDAFSKEFLLAQGVELNEIECKPIDPVTTERLIKAKEHPSMASAVSNNKNVSDNDKLRRYLEYQGKVLCFDCILDETDRQPFGECITYKIYYYLEDDTVAVRELKENREGRDHFPMLLKRTKLPKNWKQKPVNFPECFLEISDKEITEYYQPKDFKIGQTIFVYGRKFLLLNCDKFTRQYFMEILRDSQPDPLTIKFNEHITAKRAIPDYLGLGTPEDSMSSCYNLVPKPPRKDIVNYLMNTNKSLRFGCTLDNAHPEDEIRKFILKFNLADGKIQINEPPIRNSGICGGRFLSPQLCMKPHTDRNAPEYYTARDFAINAVLTINNHRFRIVSADLYVYRYMQQHPEYFSSDAIDSVRNYCLLNGNLKDDIKNALMQDSLKNNQTNYKQSSEEFHENAEVTVDINKLKLESSLIGKAHEQPAFHSDITKKSLAGAGTPIEIQQLKKPSDGECPFNDNIYDDKEPELNSNYNNNNNSNKLKKQVTFTN